MKQIVILIFCVFLSTTCSKIETASTENIPMNTTLPASVSPSVEIEAPLKPIVTKVKLNSKQKKYLDESLPAQVREFLEKAEKFTILAEVWDKFEDDKEWMVFEPNYIAKITKEDDKKEILETLYFDASRETALSACFYPRHAIEATHQGKTIRVEICYTCSLFVVEGDLGHFEGTITRENRKSENVFKKIIQNQGVETKK